MKKYFLETHGCQMNVHDSEKAAFALAQSGFSPTTDPSDADLILLNTCMVREKPEQKVFRRIQDLRRQVVSQADTPSEPVFGVMGCVAQAEAERIFERSPVVRLVVGTQSVGKIPSMLQQLESGFRRAIDVSLERDAAFFNIDFEGRQSKQTAYVSIIEGCNKFCSFCIVPYTRGRERSRPAESILAEVQQLAACGIQEVQLLGQNVNSYGLSGRLRGNIQSGARTEDGVTFAGLLSMLAEKGGVPRIKFTTSHPRDFDSDIVRVIDSHESLCEWIHLPVQSGSDRVLRMMRRGYTRADYLKKIEDIRAGKKDYAITGDFIIGFPGETEEDFRETLSLMAEVEYDGLYIFKYSPRPGTPASAYSDSVPEQVKTERFMRAQELQSRIQQVRFGRYVGRQLEVLVEGTSARSDEQLMGHSRCNKVVNFSAASDERSSMGGKIVRVVIDSAGRNSLRGHLAGIA